MMVVYTGRGWNQLVPDQQTPPPERAVGNQGSRKVLAIDGVTRCLTCLQWRPFLHFDDDVSVTDLVVTDYVQNQA